MRYMANPVVTFFKAMFGNKKNNNELQEDINEATKRGEIVAKNAADRMGFVEQVDIDAEEARKLAEEKAKTTKNDEKEKE